MRFELKIDYPIQKMKASWRRMEAWKSFRYVDRVPVGYCVVPRYFAPIVGLRYLDYFRDAETQYRWQLEFAKYRIEHIPEDTCTEPVVTVHPYFDNVIAPSAQGGEVGWVENGPPHPIPVIHTVEQMECFPVAQPNAGLRGKVIEWWRRMKELVGQTRVTFNGREGRVEVGMLSLSGPSSHLLAIDLVGEDFYWWMVEYPDACHRFLAKITRGEIAAEKLARRIDPRPRGDFYGLNEDGAEVLSAEMFRAFCVPYTGAMFEHFGSGLPFGRGLHMCGNCRHLLMVLKDELKITHFEAFGYMVPSKEAAEILGGTTLLWGNINPMIMETGSPDDVKREARACLEAMAPYGGLLLGDGANVCPGTPLASFQAVMEAAEEFGMDGNRLPHLEG